MKTLKITHNAGFFSCCSIKLLDIVNYFNLHQSLPDAVDSSTQFINYKTDPNIDLTPYYFKENAAIKIGYENDRREITMATEEPQFSDYRKICFPHTNLFRDKYFFPSDEVQNKIEHYLKKYNIQLSNTCAVFYRGNDKARETKIAPYQSFIDKCKEIEKVNPTIQFLVQPDEKEFLEAFQSAFPNNTIYIDEIPCLNKQDSCMFFELPLEKRASFGLNFLAATIILGQCKHLVTHSGNCGFWATIYRGNAINLHQILNNKWF